MTTAAATSYLLEALLQLSAMLRPGTSKEAVVGRFLQLAHQLCDSRDQGLVLFSDGVSWCHRLTEPQEGSERLFVERIKGDFDPRRAGFGPDTHEIEFPAGDGRLVVENPRGGLEALSPLVRQLALVLDGLRRWGQIESEARIDDLTGAFNYRHLMRRLHQEIARAGQTGERFAVLMVDVDNLKEYNDRHGHLGGSAALQELAILFRDCTRESDVIAKYGGDEFTILLPDTTLTAAIDVSRAILDRVETHNFEGDPDRHLTVTIGVSQFPDDGDEPRALLQRADGRLFGAKRRGRNRVGLAKNSDARPQKIRTP